ncbi:MAG: FecR domain-containing protein [Prevotellaceae bacterium]|jgi:ferric-dicitrate binding protein FerR (iron transport regulator)|nr:FecR domain-containing protein [Prevotellaceae bacterium]
MYKTDKTVHAAWECFLDGRYNNEDLKIILESIKDDEDFQAFYQASEREWKKSESIVSQDTEADREMYKQQVSNLLAEYDKQRKNSSINRRPKKIKMPQIVFRYAAAVILLCSISLATYHFTRPKQIESSMAEIQYLETKTGRGEVKSLFLPDNSKLTLNANSSVKYPAVFAKDRRMIELQGEAIFDVVANPEAPFTVKSGEMQVQVLGTSFDVKSYQEDNQILVSVASGKVSVDIAGNKALLTANKQIKFDKTNSKAEILEIEAEKYFSWADGTLYFSRTPIREVINMINRRYPHVNMELADGEYRNLISGEHDNKSFESVLTSIIYSTRMKYRNENGKIVIYKD